MNTLVADKCGLKPPEALKGVFVGLSERKLLEHPNHWARAIEVLEGRWTEKKQFDPGTIRRVLLNHLHFVAPRASAAAAIRIEEETGFLGIEEVPAREIIDFLERERDGADQGGQETVWRVEKKIVKLNMALIDRRGSWPSRPELLLEQLGSRRSSESPGCSENQRLSRTGSRAGWRGHSIPSRALSG